MVNEPMPWQLTVGQLKEALLQAPDEAVVALRVPPEGLAGGGPVGSIFYNLRVEYTGGVIVKFVPFSKPSPSDGREP